jgi:ectoine hydroxylase-related dioxygenase (phytanoyl-CoA dioxygenase family)
MYWPGSHRIIWQYFCEFPEDYLAHGERSHNQVFERLVGRMRSAPVEFIGAPGDILIWHPLILHSASINKQREARLAVFGHWGIRVGDESLYDFREDMWTYWQFGEPNRED